MKIENKKKVITIDLLTSFQKCNQLLDENICIDILLKCGTGFSWNFMYVCNNIDFNKNNREPNEVKEMGWNKNKI